MKFQIPYKILQDECTALCGETVQYCFVADNKSKGKRTFHFADGKKPIGYLVGVTANGLYLVPFVGKKNAPEIRYSEAFFLADTVLKKMRVIREYPVYTIQVFLQNGDCFRWKVKTAGKHNAETRRHLKDLRAQHSKDSRRAEARHYTAIAVGLFMTVIALSGLVFLATCDTGTLIALTLGKPLVAQAQEYGQSLFTPLLPYTQTDSAFAGETQEYRNADFSVRFPKKLALERETDEQLQYGNADTDLLIVIYKKPFIVDFEQEFSFSAEAKANCKTYFGIVPDSWYNYQKIGYGLDFNTFDPKDEVACQLYAAFMLTKTLEMKDAAYYCAESENCNMLLSVSTHADADENPRTFFSAELYNPALPNQFYTVTVSARTPADLETAYAVLNSVAFAL